MSKPRKNILFITTSRSDFASIAPLMTLLHKDKNLNTLLFATGDHYSKQAGETYKQIKGQGISIDAMYRIKSDNPADAVGEIVSVLPGELKKLNVSYAVVCGDRKEAFAAAVACALSRVPLFHIHGGDVTYGMIDDSMRHAITKLSSIHFPASPLSSRRIKQMGEEAWRVYMTGSPDTDGLQGVLPEHQTLSEIGVNKKGYAVLLLNPETLLDKKENSLLTRTVVHALKKAYKGKVVVIYPNNDPSSQDIRDVYDALKSEQFLVHRGLPRAQYVSLLKNAAFLIGNSSSGITEAASFKTPVINVGRRQDGRERNGNVIDVASTLVPIERAIKKATSPAYLRSIKNLKNLYGNGYSSVRIYRAIKEVDRKYDTPALLYKKFTLL